MDINLVKKVSLIKVVAVVLIISLVVSALYVFAPWRKKTSVGNLIMVGTYSNKLSDKISDYKPLLLIVNPIDYSVEKVDLDTLGLKFAGIHEARAFTENGKYKLALATYNNGGLAILGSGNSSLKNLKVEFEDKLADTYTQRVRALSVGDVNGDGKDDIVIGTRPDGILKYYQFINGKWSGSIIDKVGVTIHDLLITDSDGDGKKEIFVTTSVSADDNILSLKPKDYIPKIIKYNLNGATWDKEVVWKSETPPLEDGYYAHPRYIFDGNFDSYEPGLVAGVIGVDSLDSLLTLKWNGGRYTESSQEIDIPLSLDIDVITSGDIDNDGKNEIVVPTLAGDSIVLFKMQGGKWERQVLAKNLIDETGSGQRIISMAVLGTTSGGYKNILIAVASPSVMDKLDNGIKTVSNNASNLTKFYILSYDPEKNGWNKKLVNTITFTDILSWGIFPTSW